MKVLNVAEKPSVAKEISRILSSGHSQRRNGQSRYNPIYEFDTSIKGSQCRMVFTSVSGHLMERDFEKDFKSWNSCEPEALFTAPIVKSVRDDESARNIESTLKQEIRSCQWLILWLDCDREGENIAFEVKEVCEKASRRRLTVYRAKFSALIPRDITYALQHLVTPDSKLSDAVDVRSEIDLRLGAAFTRFQTLCLQHKYAGLEENVISYGPCQFPTLGFVVDRYKKIQEFVREAFWNLVVTSTTQDDVKTTFQWNRGRLFDRVACIILYERCLNSPSATVTKVDAKDINRRKPVPLNTIELQKRASRWLRMSSETTMKVAEALYNRGIISYPRTETEKFKDGTDITSLLQIQESHGTWGPYVNTLLHDQKFEHPRNGRQDDEAHPPIHPTKSVNLSELQNSDEKKLYELVTRHFLACCSKDALGHQTKVEIDIAAERFSTSGQMIIERNYLDIYTYDKWSSSTIPVFRAGDVFTPSSIDLNASETAPPSLLSESDLIAAMDRNGIGTDATIAEHINTIQKRKYATKVNRLFSPTPLGVALVEGYTGMGFHLSKPDLRAAMERDCKAIALGTQNSSQVMTRCLGQMKQIFQQVVQHSDVLESAVAAHFGTAANNNSNNSAMSDQSSVLVENRFSKCGDCTNIMELRKQNEVRKVSFLKCHQCSRTHALPLKGSFTPHTHSCPICSFQVLQVSSGNGYSGNGYTICPKCYHHPPQGTPVGTMPCFKCTHEGCPLATSQNSNPAIMQCTDCNVKPRVLKKTSTDKWVVSCTGYPQCKAPSLWLPASCKDVEVSSTLTCSRCSTERNVVKKLVLSFAPGSMPPDIQSPYTGCALCDEVINPMTRNSLNSTRVPPPQPPLRQQQNVIDQSYQQLADGMLRNNTSSSKCDCGITASRLICKQGPNSGKSFFKCSKPRDDQCEFFQWENTEPSRTFESSYTAAAMNLPTSNENDNTVCNCMIPVKTLTCQQGPNAGRPFFKCSKQSRDDQCDFFQWGDEVKGPECQCRLPTILLTVKQGPNAGREFFKCSKRQENGQCDFFEWKEDGGNNNIGGRTSNNNTNAGPSCHCNEPSVELTVRKGPNEGKLFFKCSKPQDQQCDFFSWKDSNTNNLGNGVQNPKCQCGVPSVELMTRKGPNEGKYFFKCAKPQGQQCDFFSWKDDSNSTNTTTTYTSNDNSVPSCDCKQSCRQFTCRQGKNEGRSFYKCSKRQGEQCSFFEWAEESDDNENNYRKKQRSNY